MGNISRNNEIFKEIELPEAVPVPENEQIHFTSFRSSDVVGAATSARDDEG